MTAPLAALVAAALSWGSVGGGTRASQRRVRVAADLLGCMPDLLDRDPHHSRWQVQLLLNRPED
ncbi:hypothetical protein ACP70R_024400 [Stipagrostis hirtigluma subsp. patula]